MVSILGRERGDLVCEEVASVAWLEGLVRSGGRGATQELIHFPADVEPVGTPNESRHVHGEMGAGGRQQSHALQRGHNIEYNALYSL